MKFLLRPEESDKVRAELLLDEDGDLVLRLNGQCVLWIRQNGMLVLNSVACGNDHDVSDVTVRP